VHCIPGALSFSAELFVVKDRTCRFPRRGGKSVGILVDLENAKSEQNASATILRCSCRLSIPSVNPWQFLDCIVELHHSIPGRLLHLTLGSGFSYRRLPLCSLQNTCMLHMRRLQCGGSPKQRKKQSSYLSLDTGATSQFQEFLCIRITSGRV
jgi:hypothetical protein